MAYLALERQDIFFQAGVDIPLMGTLSFVIVGFIVICAWAYWKEPCLLQNQTVIYFRTIICFLTFGLSLWHPQWLVFAIPFLVLGTVTNKKANIFLLLDIVMFAAFILITVNVWSDIIQDMPRFASLMPFLAGKGDFKFPIRSILFIRNVSLPFSIFSGILLCSRKLCTDLT